MSRSLRPPRLASRLLWLVAPVEDREVLLGDLEEEYLDLLERSTGFRAGIWAWRQALGSTLPCVRLRLQHQRRRARQNERKGNLPMAELWTDLKVGLRSARRAPGFFLTVVLTLALGIASNTVIWGVVDGLVLNPFSYPDPERLVGIGTAYPRLDKPLDFWEVLSPPEYVDIASSAHTLEKIVAWDMGYRQLSGSEAPESVFTAFWWGDAFATLGVEPALGRGFLPHETAKGEPVAVLSHRIWSRRFGGDREIVGRTLFVNGNPYTVVGIMAPGTSIYGTDLWIPMTVGPEVIPRQVRNFQILARLAPGVELEEANAELMTIAGRIEQEHGAEHEEYEGFRLEAATWTEVNVRQARPAALILLGAVGFVLLLVCVNVAGLLLARAARRRGEMALRSALGAGRGRLLRQLLTESLLFALLGGGLALLLTHLGIRSLMSAIGSLGLPMAPEVSLDGRVLAYAGLITLFTGLLVGLLPALQAGRSRLVEHLKAGTAAAQGGRAGPRLQQLFVGVEVALALVLLVGGGLLISSFLRMQRVDPGFETDNLLSMRLTLPWERYEGEEIADFFEQLEERVAAIPGVERVGSGTCFPPIFLRPVQLLFEGRPATAEGALPTALSTVTTPEYLATLGIPLLEGRSLSREDAFDGPPVAVVSSELVRRYFPDGRPLGKRFKLGSDEEAPWIEIVGVVEKVRNRGLDRTPMPEIYLALRQATFSNQLYLLVRSALPAQALLPQIRQAVAALDPDQPVYAVQTVNQAFASASAARNVATLSLLLFAAFALVLASVGIYAVASYAVAERTSEIGLRIALGASGRQILVWVLQKALLPVAGGVLAGLVLSVLLGRALAGLLFEVQPGDPVTLLTVTLFFAAVAFLATAIPARRAARLDPVRTLRAE